MVKGIIAASHNGETEIRQIGTCDALIAFGIKKDHTKKKAAGVQVLSEADDIYTSAMLDGLACGLVDFIETMGREEPEKVAMYLKQLQILIAIEAAEKNTAYLMDLI